MRDVGLDRPVKNSFAPVAPSTPGLPRADAADQIEQQILNRYRAGQLGYTDVVTAQASALSARRTLVQTAVNRQVTAITLIQALGGGWDSGAPVEIKSSVRVDNPR